MLQPGSPSQGDEIPVSLDHSRALVIRSQHMPRADHPPVLDANVRVARIAPPFDLQLWREQRKDAELPPSCQRLGAQRPGFRSAQSYMLDRAPHSNRSGAFYQLALK